MPTSRPKGELLNWLGKDPRSAEDISLETFLSCISEHPPKHMNPHWRVQYYQTMQGLIDYQFIGRFEAIEDDLRKTLHTINADGVSGIVDVRPHATNASKINLMDISSEARTLIYSIYEIDYDFFKY